MIDADDFPGDGLTNTTIELSSGKVFGLTADLLLEAVAWATGGEPQRGIERLGELEDWNAMREAETK